ncbi:MAG: DUF3857 domain-containing transglutaminase family protein [Candidatus Omnitrophica bacterium]|nr:DUF3857 domain-containing transglutaminase family protein [Candidatus Omnitrophota bacterium]
MKKIFLAFLTVLFCAPAWAQNKPLTWEEKNADQPYIVLLSEYQTILHPDWSYEETYHARVKIQKEAGKELGQWPVYYNKSREEVSDIQAHVETPDGHQYPATNIQDLQVYNDAPMYSDMRMKVVTMPQVNIGSVIEVKVKSKIVHKEIVHQFWDDITYPFIPTKHASHVYIFPEDKPIPFQAYKSDYKPTLEKTQGQIKYTFVFNETGPIGDDEELMPPLQEALGGLYLSSIKDWKMIADWYRDLIHKNTVSDVDIALKALELTKDKTTQKDKARAILEFLQDNFRYVALNFGNNTVEPHPTNEVFKNRYGDCKDLSLLAKQMLKVADIDANICLFSGEFNGNPQSGLPNPSVFDHIILQINLDGQNYFVDPQIKGFDFGQFPSSYDNAYVMSIDETGYKFDNLPVAFEEDHSLTSRADITVNGDGSAVFGVHVKLPLEASQNFKQSWSSSTNKDKDKFFENLEQNFAQGGKMLDRKVQGIENRYGPVEFDLKYESPTAYPIVNDMILIKEENQSNIPDFSQEHRRYPIFVPGNSVVKNINIYHIPDGFKVNFMPSNYALTIDLMDVSANYLKKDNTVGVDSTYRTKRSIVAVNRYQQVRDFRKELFKKNDQYVVLKKTSSLPPEAKDWIKNQ